MVLFYSGSGREVLHKPAFNVKKIRYITISSDTHVHESAMWCTYHILSMQFKDLNRFHIHVHLISGQTLILVYRHKSLGSAPVILIFDENNDLILKRK